ncbi:hypothetical protein [Kribbella sp. NPDC023855]|uniref:hypothetical protein n=1 Tax=Kribbella sp. NPDC023855 TaxID=3154698 RepID=UPI0033FBA138
MSRGKLVWVGVVACTAAMLTACSPTESGVIGVTVDEAGKVIVVLQDCKGDIDKLKLLDHVQTETTADDVVLAEWSNPRSPKGIVQFPLVEGAKGWKSQAPVPELDPTHRYSLKGRKKDGSSNAAAIAFTPTMLNDLQPGQILITKVLPRANSTETVSLDEFTPEDCG